MKISFKRVKALCASLSAIGLMTASFGLGSNVGSVSAYGRVIQGEPGNPHIIDDRILPDPVFRAYVAANVDADGDGWLTEEEVLAITSINVDFMNISSLYGIQAFRNLTDLSCRGNFISNLDVSSMPNLTNLYCEDNGMTALNVSNCGSLETLYCASNDLTVLNIQGEDAIVDLDCSGNDLTELDVSACEDLRFLDCSDNDLFLLDVMSKENLQTLDCKNNPDMEWLFACDCRSLISIDCTNCDLVEALFIASGRLETVYCYGNRMGSIALISWGEDSPYLYNAVNGTVTDLGNGRVSYTALSGAGYIEADAATPVWRCTPWTSATTTILRAPADRASDRRSFLLATQFLMLAFAWDSPRRTLAADSGIP